MTIQDVKIEFQSKLTNIYDTKEIQSICFLFLEHIGISKTESVIEPQYKLLPEQLQLYEHVISRLQQYEPIQYILGYADFYGLRFLVNRSVLIPRQETELLIDMLVARYAHESSLRVLDACSGSGCIAISIAKNITNVSVLGIDISEKAIDVAIQNAQNNSVSVPFLKFDILDSQMYSSIGKFDVIVSNPPYVRQSEKQYMQTNVLRFEPEIALFVEDSNPLVFYDALAQLGQETLVSGGSVFCEINEAYGSEISELFQKAGYISCTIIKDLHEKNRFIHSVKK